jgi:hypothetical protein
LKSRLPAPLWCSALWVRTVHPESGGWPYWGCRLAGDWIKWVKGLTRRREVVQMSFTLKADPRLIAAVCMEVWEWVDGETTDGHLPGCGLDYLDSIARMAGFGEAMAKAGWVSVGEDGITIPNFDRHNGASAKRRSAASESMRKRRANKEIGEETTPEEDDKPSTSAQQMLRASATPSSLLSSSLSSSVSSSSSSSSSSGSSSPKSKPKKPQHTKLTEENALAIHTPMHWPPELRAAWVSFIEMRYSINAPVTPNAVGLLIAELEKYPAEKRVDVANQSTRNSWRDFFPLKEQSNGRNGTGYVKPNKRDGEHAESLGRPRMWSPTKPA